MKTDQSCRVVRITENSLDETTLNLIGEEPLAIRIQGNPYAVIMRTPGEEIAHVAGFCLGEGLVESPDDFNVLSYCEDDVNVVTATLSTKRQEKVAGLLLRRGYISQTSCGICGKELVDDLKQQIAHVGPGRTIDPACILSSLNGLADHQPLRGRTRAAHGAALFTAEGKILSSAEDVGRHNALDKTVGKLFLSKKLHEASFAVMSSRISYELVQKAAMAKIPVLAGISRPTALAVDLAQSLNMSLLCLDGAQGLYSFCGQHRLLRS